MNGYLERIRRRLADAGVWHEILERHKVRLTQRTADVGDRPSHSFVQSVVVILEDRPCLLVLPVSHAVDLVALRRDVAVSTARMATEAETETLFPDCELGAIPPFAEPGGMPVLMDRDLRDVPEIIFEAGSHTEVVRMRTADYMRLVQPGILSFARDPSAGSPRFRLGGGNVRPWRRTSSQETATMRKRSSLRRAS